MPFCSQCGTEVSVQARFCSACGAEANPARQAAEREPPTPSDVERERDIEPRAGRRLPSLGGLIFGVLIIVGIAVFYKEVFIPEKEKARTVTCQSNLKQVALGLKMYIQDYGDTCPTYDGNGGWVTSIMPYIKNDHVFICPSAPQLRTNGYVMNINLSGVREGAVANFSQAVYLWDGTMNSRSGANDCSEFALRHGFNHGLNALWLDGHVKWVIPDSPQFDCTVRQVSDETGD